MKILDRYIGREVVATTLLVVAVLLGIESFMLLFAEIGDIGKADYSIFKALTFVFLQLPAQCYQLFPVAGFLGCLLGLGRLSATGELVVMRAGGVSIRRIGFSVLKAVLILIVLVTLIGEILAPKSQYYAAHMKARALGKEKDFSGMGGVWLKNQDQFIYIGNIHSTEKAGEVNTFKLQGRQLVQAQFSRKAHKQGSGWQMQAVEQTDFGPMTLASTQLEQQQLETKFDPVVLALGQASLDQLSTLGLARTIHYREKAKLNVLQYRFAFWQHLLAPFVCMLMILLGVPFVFNTPRSTSAGYRVFLGLVIGFSFYMLNQFLGPLAVVYQIAPYLVALIPIVLSLALCAMLFRRI